MNTLIIADNLMVCKVLLIISNFAKTNDRIPNLCDHFTRYDSLTQYRRIENSVIKLEYFVTSGGYYWMIGAEEDPSVNVTKGKLPNGFRRGDAVFFREWTSCPNVESVPQLILIEHFENETNIENSQKFIIYFIDNNTWSSPKLINQDLVLRNLGINKNEKVDAIINLSNIKVGPFANQTGDEFLFSFQTQTIESVTDYYYNVLNFSECFGQERGITHKFKSIPVKQTLWIMKKPIDAAFVFIDYTDQ